VQAEALASEKRCLSVMAEAIWPAALGSLTLVISKVHSDADLLQACARACVCMCGVCVRVYARAYRGADLLQAK
jgi:hypothetical protein